jgi:hypothetical protein
MSASATPDPSIPCVLRCTACGTLHFVSGGSQCCPQCKAADYRQTSWRDYMGRPLQTHANAARAYSALALRLLKESETAAAKAVAHTALSRAKGEPL